MEELWLYLGLALLLLIPIGIGAMILYGSRIQKRNTEAWREVAAQLGFTFIEDDRDFHTRYPFRLFLSGSPSRRSTSDIIRGTIRGMNVNVATFFNRGLESEAATICLIENTPLELPEFSLVCRSSDPTRHNYLGSTIEGGVVYERARVNFEEDATFSETFVLRGADEEQVRLVMTANRRRFFVDLKATSPGFVVEANGDSLLFFQRNKKIDPETEQCRKFIDESILVLDQFK